MHRCSAYCKRRYKYGQGIYVTRCKFGFPGLAAFNVGGVTIHRLFQLPIVHDSHSAGYWTLPKVSQKNMKTTLKNVKLFITDEVSMVSNLNLTYIHLRLDELFGDDD